MVSHALPHASDLCQPRSIQGLVQQPSCGHGGGSTRSQQGTQPCIFPSCHSTLIFCYMHLPACHSTLNACYMHSQQLLVGMVEGQQEVNGPGSSCLSHHPECMLYASCCLSHHPECMLYASSCLSEHPEMHVIRIFFLVASL